MKKSVIKILFAAAGIAFLFAGCMSMQKDIYVEEEAIADGGFSQEMESRISMVDADFFSGAAPEKNASARTYILNQLDSKLEVQQLDKNQESRLQALKGRVLLLGGNRSQAEKCYVRAKKLNPAEVQVVVLERRLGLRLNLADELSDLDNNGVLVLEAALELFENAKYDEAVGLFDRAFIVTAPFYRSSYQAVRDKAWDLKDITSLESYSALFMKESINLTEFLELTQNTTGLLDFYTGGRKLSGSKLYVALAKAGLLDSKSACEESDPEVPQTAKTVTSRYLCARFLWNIYTRNKNDSVAVKYSTKARAKDNPKSPVSDVGVYSRDYDAVIGCVENEFMSLVDGKKFEGEKPVSVAEIMTGLSALESELF